MTKRVLLLLLISVLLLLLVAVVAVVVLLTAALALAVADRGCTAELKALTRDVTAAAPREGGRGASLLLICDSPTSVLIVLVVTAAVVRLVALGVLHREMTNALSLLLASNSCEYVVYE
jgi:hypothetical protein